MSTNSRHGGLQDQFLNAIRRSKSSTTVFLVKGVKLQGAITSFDSFSVLLRREGASQLLYKHAISTIQPSSVEEHAFEPPELAAPRLQDSFLSAAFRQREPMTIFLVNGVMLQGRVGGFDPFVVLLERQGQWQMVYKHAISTLQPAGTLDLSPAERGDEA